MKAPLPPPLARLRDDLIAVALMSAVRDGELGPFDCIQEAAVAELRDALERNIDKEMRVLAEPLLRACTSQCLCGRPWCRHDFYIRLTLTRQLDEGVIDSHRAQTAYRLASKRLKDYFAQRS